MTKTVRTMLRASAALPFALIAAPAMAQDEGSTPGAGDEGTIVVTALKREQTLIEVPQSISVIGGETLERQQAYNFQDYLKLVPGLQLDQTTPGFGRLVLRGVNTGGVASTVAVYLDETTLGSSSGQANGAILAGDIDTFDIARVEVLRGPQGTLYGASSLGGVLKFVTNPPRTDAFEARARASVETVSGGDLSYFGSALINVPLGEAIAFRASGFYREIGGFIDSIGTGGSDVEENINDSRSYGGRAAVLFEPSDRFSIKLSAMLQNLENNASNAVDSDPVTGRTLYGRLTQSQFVPEFSDITYRIYNGTANFDLGFADFISVTSYSTLEQRFRGDLTTQFSPLIEAIFGTPNEFFQNQITGVDRFTQEIRLSSKSNDSFEWLVGGYYTNEEGVIDQDFDAVTPGTFTSVEGLPLLGVARIDSKYEEVAAFANATVYLGDRFDISFGGRYSRNEQTASQVSDGVLAGGPIELLDNRSDEDVFTYSVAPRFELNERASIYARVAKGFRPGGPNILPPGAPTSIAIYDSDSLVSYEIGFKGETADGTFGLDIAGFHIDWSNIQLFAVISDFGVNANGGGARSDGIEFTATLRPTTGFNVSINGAYTDAKLTDDTDPIVGGRDGDRLPYTPKYSIGVNSDYEWDLNDRARAFVGGSLRFLSEQPAGFDPAYVAANGRQLYLPSYEVVDLRAGVDLGRFTLEAYVKNLTNSQGKTSAGTVGNLPNGAIGTGVIRPRAFGLTLGADF